MWKYIVKRLLLMIPITLVVTFFIYAILNINSDKLAYKYLSIEATDEEVATWNAAHDMDKPVVYRFGKYVYNIVVKQDWGISYMNNKPIFPQIKDKLPVSIYLAVVAMFLATAVGIPLGVVSAVKQYSALDKASTVAALTLSAVPSFWLAMMLQVWFVVSIRLFPASGLHGGIGLILPMFSLGLPYAASEFRYTRTTMLETIRTGYIDTARSKGVPERKVINKHALKNALLPVITVTCSNFAGLIGGAVVNETIYGLPGIGSYLQTGITNRDTPVVCGCIIILALINSLMVLLSDLMHASIDPRVRARYAKKG